MTTIYAVTSDQELVATILPTLSTNNVGNVRLWVDFDSEWASYPARSAVFTTSKSSRPYEVLLSDEGFCLLPSEVLTEDGKVYITVVGLSTDGKKKSSTRMAVKVRKGTPAVIVSDPTPGVYQQLAAEAAVLSARQSALEAAGTVEGSEVIGIRTAADGTEYATAGDAVRGQFTEVAEKLNGIVRFTPEWTDGAYLSKGGNVVEHDGYSISSMIPVRPDVADRVTVHTCASVDSTAYGFFDLYGKHIEGANIGYNATDVRTYVLTVPEGAAFLRYTCKTAKTAASYVELNVSPAAMAAHLNEEAMEADEPLFLDVTNGAQICTYATVGTGAIATTSNEAVQCAEVLVGEGESYEIKGYSVSAAALYALYDAKGKCLATYPSETDGSYTYHAVTVTIPANCAKMIVGHYMNRTATTVKLVNHVECLLAGLKESREGFKAVGEQLDAAHLYRFAVDSVLCIGDSLTAGAYYANGWTGASIKQGYPYYLSKLCNCSVTNAGRSGWSASDWVRGMLGAYSYADYDAAVLWLGTNYGCVKMPTDAEIAAFAPAANPTASTADQALYLIHIIRTIQESNPDCLILLGTIYASKASVGTNNTVVRQIAEKYGARMVDLSDLGYSKHPELHAGINNPHLGKAGNIYVANRVANAIHAYIAEDPTRAEFGLKSI